MAHGLWNTYGSSLEWEAQCALLCIALIGERSPTCTDMSSSVGPYSNA